MSNYLLQVDVGKYKYLDCGRYVHSEEPDIIADEMKNFIKSTLQSTILNSSKQGFP